MHEDLLNLKNAIDTLAYTIRADSVIAEVPLSSTNWSLPSLNKYQSSQILITISEYIEQSDIKKISPEDAKAIQQCIVSINHFTSKTLPQLFTGNAANAFPNFVALIQHIQWILMPIIGWHFGGNKVKIPAKLRRKIENLSDTVEKCIVDEADLRSKIDIIESAHQAAEELPTTQKQLSEAKNSIEESSETASQLLGKIDESWSNSRTVLELIKNDANESKALAEQCSKAYNIATSTGLAAAFNERAKSLAWSVKLWVFGLVLALISGGYVATIRFDNLSRLLTNDLTSDTIIIIELVLSIMSIGLPGWFIWLSTAQIGQRFRLSEDYAFKASVAQAYEGYRRQASRFSSDIEERLFKAALTRFEEEPLRYVDKNTPSSPLEGAGLIDTAKETFESGAKKAGQVVDTIVESVANDKKGS